MRVDEVRVAERVEPGGEPLAHVLTSVAAARKAPAMNIRKPRIAHDLRPVAM